jgi:putative DNA primase/helicase
MMAALADDKVVPIKSGIDPALSAVLDIRDTIGLRLNEKRKPISCLENAVTILLSADDWRDVFGYNEFSLAIEKMSSPPFAQPSVGEWTDADDNELRLWMSQQFDLRVSEKDVAAAVGLVARRHSYHPVRRYLDGLAWDREERLDGWLLRYLGASVPENDMRTPEYYRRAGAWWLISAVARIYRPGCQADHVLLLEGKQGSGKSTTLRILFGEWFSETPLRIGDKDSYGALRGVWGYELSELDSLNRAETTASKAFFTAIKDKYRPPYGHRDIMALRQVVFAGTTNADEYLRDSTGNRRYWPVRCGEIVLRGEDSLEAHRDQLWAEAVVRYRNGERWYPETEEQRELFGEQQVMRELGDVYEAMIAEGVKGRTEISMVDIFKDILDTEPAKMTRPEQTRVGQALHRLGWKKKRTGNRQDRSYVYVRTETEEKIGERDDGVPF